MVKGSYAARRFGYRMTGGARAGYRTVAVGAARPVRPGRALHGMTAHAVAGNLTVQIVILIAPAISRPAGIAHGSCRLLRSVATRAGGGLRYVAEDAASPVVFRRAFWRVAADAVAGGLRRMQCVGGPPVFVAAGTGGNRTRVRERTPCPVGLGCAADSMTGNALARATQGMIEQRRTSRPHRALIQVTDGTFPRIRTVRIETTCPYAAGIKMTALAVGGRHQ